MGLAPAGAVLHADAPTESEYSPSPSHAVHLVEPPMDASPNAQSAHAVFVVIVQGEETY